MFAVKDISSSSGGFMLSLTALHVSLSGGQVHTLHVALFLKEKYTNISFL